MARMRSIKPEYWADRKAARMLSRDARLLYIGLWNFADEHSRMHGDARYVKGQVFPYDDDIDLDAIDRLLAELDAAGRVVRYEVDGDPYLFLPKLGKHQRLEPGKVPSRLPAPWSEPVADQGADLGADLGANESESRADEFAPGADELSLSMWHVAGSREHVAGGRKPDGFAEFWELYPRKTAKGAAEKAWPKAVKRAGDPDRIVQGLRDLLPTLSRSEPQFIPHPATWLNAGRWEDEIAPRRAAGSGIEGW